MLVSDEYLNLTASSFFCTSKLSENYFTVFVYGAGFLSTCQSFVFGWKCAFCQTLHLDNSSVKGDVNCLAVKLSSAVKPVSLSSVTTPPSAH